MSQPEVITINSEALEATIRDLLPSQNGFGSELQASNVIMPIIDLTATAEGSALPDYLQQALSFNSQTTFSADNSTVAIASTPGFYRIYAAYSTTANVASGGTTLCQLLITDGASTKNIWAVANFPNNQQGTMSGIIDLIVYLNAGETLQAATSHANAKVQGSSRQIADVAGDLVNPAGLVIE